MEKYITGTGQIIAVHDKKDCNWWPDGTKKSEFCVIHNPSNHHMKDWPTHWRQDRGIMERICKCGVGHPDPDDLAFKKAVAEKQKTKRRNQTEYPNITAAEYDYDIGIHGCCGCCIKK